MQINKVVSLTVRIYENWFISLIGIQDQNSLFLGNIAIINRTRTSQRTILLTRTVQMIHFEVCYALIFTISVIITFNDTLALIISQNIRAYGMTHAARVIQAFCEGFLRINYFSKHKNRNFRQQVRYNSKLGCYNSCNHQCNQCDKDTNRCILRNPDCKS